MFKSMLQTLIQNQRLEFLHNPSIQQNLRFIQKLTLLIVSTTYAASTTLFKKNVLFYTFMYIVTHNIYFSSFKVHLPHTHFSYSWCPDISQLPFPFNGAKISLVVQSDGYN